MTQLNGLDVQTIYNHTHHKYGEPSVLVVIHYEGVSVFEGDYFKRIARNKLISRDYELYFFTEDCIVDYEVFNQLLENPVTKKRIHGTINKAFENRKGNQDT